jgi:hypothetical protein
MKAIINGVEFKMGIVKEADIPKALVNGAPTRMSALIEAYVPNNSTVAGVYSGHDIDSTNTGEFDVIDVAVTSNRPHSGAPVTAIQYAYLMLGEVCYWVASDPGVTGAEQFGGMIITFAEGAASRANPKKLIGTHEAALREMGRVEKFKAWYSRTHQPVTIDANNEMHQ